MSTPKPGQQGEPLLIDEYMPGPALFKIVRRDDGHLVRIHVFSFDNADIADERSVETAQRIMDTYNALDGRDPAALAGLERALTRAGEWVAAVEPKLPMPGTGDSQQEVLDMLRAALAAFGVKQ